MKSRQLCAVINVCDEIHEEGETAHKYSSQSLLTHFKYF